MNREYINKPTSELSQEEILTNVIYRLNEATGYMRRENEGSMTGISYRSQSDVHRAVESIYRLERESRGRFKVSAIDILSDLVMIGSLPFKKERAIDPDLSKGDCTG